MGSLSLTSSLSADILQRLDDIKKSGKQKGFGYEKFYKKLNQHLTKFRTTA